MWAQASYQAHVKNCYEMITTNLLNEQNIQQWLAVMLHYALSFVGTFISLIMMLSQSYTEGRVLDMQPEAVNVSFNFSFYIFLS